MNISSVNTTAGYISDKNSNNGPAKEINNSNGDLLEANAPIVDKQNDKNIERLIKSLEGPDTMVERSVHEGTNHIVYKLKNKESGEIIREIPEEKILDMAAKFIELNGLMIDEKI